MQDIPEQENTSSDLFPKWLWPKIAARILNIHYTTLWRWVKQGRISAVTVGNRTRFDPKEVQRVKQQIDKLADLYLEMRPDYKQEQEKKKGTGRKEGTPGARSS